MKKYILPLFLFACFASNLWAQPSQTACCPEFELLFKKDSRNCCKDCKMDGITACMCKFSTNTFLVVPNLTGYSYSWVVAGGTLSSATSNPVNITWGGGSIGTVMVTITSADGSCVKTIKENICLRDAPQAFFTFTPNNSCAGTVLTFTNQSTGGAHVSWDFGDGSFAGNENSPTHVYASANTYPVTLTVCNDTIECNSSHQNPAGGDNPKPCCGCCTTYTLMVTVSPGNPLTIVPKECINQCLCEGDTAEYCATTVCSTYNWSVSGGAIISGLGTQCVKVRWTGPYPTSLALNTPGCGNTCGDSATLNVPVLVNNIPILPNTSPVCQNSVQTYYLPAMPGVFYTWGVTGSGTILGPSLNTSDITVSWGAGTSGQVTCTYKNPLKPDCFGTSTLPVSLKPELKIIGPGQTCEGCSVPFSTLQGSVTWSAVPSTGVTFSSTSGSSTIVTFALPATYTITGTGGSGVYCNSPVSATIIVAPKPILSVVPATASACPGEPVKFVATSNVTATPINWVLPAGATMVANTGTQSDTAIIQFGTIPPGGITVTATQNCAFNLSCSQGSASVTVKKPLPPVFSPGLVTNPCIDQTLTYSISNYIPGINYTWAIVNGSGNPSNLGTITGGQGSGSVQILWHGNTTNLGSVTVSNCGGTTTLPIQVTLPVFPTITTSGSLCNPPGMTLTSSSATSYLWSTGQTTQSITITQPGTYSVTTNSGALGSCAQSKSIVIPLNPYWVRIIPPCSISSCDPASLSVPLTVSTNITPSVCQWYFQPPGGGPFTVISTACGNYTATLSGTYYLVMTNPNGCRDTSNYIRIPQDINICCSTPACNALSGTQFIFTHSGCQPTSFTGTPLSLPSGWTTGTLHPAICYGDGTGEDFASLNTSHQYPAAGQYNACVVQKVVNATTGDTCCIINCRQVTIPVVTKLIASFNCNTGLLSMNDASSYYPGNSGASYTWTYSGAYSGTINNGIGQTSQVITPTTSGTFNVTLSITLAGCTSTYSWPVTVVIPVAPITMLPNPSCFGSPVNYSCSTNGMAQYYWQFGDGSFSYLQNPEHSYTSTGTYNVTLTATTPEGCVVVTNGSVTIQPKPVVTLTPNPITICPGSSILLTASMNPNGNTMCPGLSSYTFQWYNGSTPVGGPTASSSLSVSNYGTYYAVLTGNSASCNCRITTDTALVSFHPKPVARIKGKSAICLTGGFGTINLSNAVGSYTGYAWSSNSPGNISFIPANTSVTTASINAPGNYQIYLTVTDGTTGCSASDTLCIYASNSPSASINVPGGILCAGNVYALQATPNPLTAPPAGYNYLWSTGAAINPINASSPGVYYVYVTDLNTGCSAISNSVIIQNGPDLSLFPSCCDTVCNNAPFNIEPPLPLQTSQNVCSIYSIVWLDNGSPISPQPSPCNMLNTSSLSLGTHNISIVVTLNNGCADTSNVFNLYIQDCTDSCNCNGSYFTNLTYTDSVDPDKIHRFECNSRLVINCLNPYSINAGYACPGSANCMASVVYFLQNSVGSVIQNGSMPFSTSGLPAGSYSLFIIGQCNSVNCDTCMVRFEIQCEPLPCCPQMSQISIRNSNENLSQQTTSGGIGYSLFTTQVSILGGTTPYTEVRATVMDFELSANFRECISCINYPFTYASLSATALAGIQPEITLPAANPGYQIPSDIYGNPREVVWENNGGLIDLSVPQSTNLSFYLPPESSIPCCGLKAKICVKYSLYDINCNLCEVVKCYEVAIGEPTLSESCCCEKWSGRPVYLILKSNLQNDSEQAKKNNPLPTPVPIGWSVRCGGVLNLSAGVYSISVPEFHCSPASCNVTYSWLVGGSQGGQVYGSGTGRTFSHNFSSPGKYTITITPKCGSCNCAPCTFEVQIGKTVSPSSPLPSTSVNNYGINDEGLKKEVRSAEAGEPVPGAEIYLEQEPRGEPIANGVTDENGEIEFLVKKNSELPATGIFSFTITPSAAFKAKHKLPASFKGKIQVPFKRNLTGKYKFVIRWIPNPDEKAQNKGSFAVSGKSDA